jgi:hypothetical protein
MQQVKPLGKKALQWAWRLSGTIGPQVALPGPQRATVVIGSYHASRTANVASLARAILKCRFVTKLIVSNHNPQLRIEDHIQCDDPRLVLINQPVRRGCGYRWQVAMAEEADYYLTLDDDQQIFPRQLAALFQHLVAQPQAPHGLAGSLNGRFVWRREMEVDSLVRLYANTRAQVRQYLDYRAQISNRLNLPDETIEYYCDDLLISRAGTGRPRIHDAGVLLEHATWNAPGVAIWRDTDFTSHRQQVQAEMDRLSH